MLFIDYVWSPSFVTYCWARLWLCLFWLTEEWPRRGPGPALARVLVPSGWMACSVQAMSSLWRSVLITCGSSTIVTTRKMQVCPATPTQVSAMERKAYTNSHVHIRQHRYHSCQKQLTIVSTCQKNWDLNIKVSTTVMWAEILLWHITVTSRSTASKLISLVTHSWNHLTSHPKIPFCSDWLTGIPRPLTFVNYTLRVAELTCRSVGNMAVM